MQNILASCNEVSPKSSSFFSSLLLLFVLQVFSASTIASITGHVWQDLPMDGTVASIYGVENTNELSLEGITVTAYANDGTVADTELTDSNGNYTLATTAGNYRIEFTWPTHLWLESSPDSANTSIQFIADAGTADFALHYPNNYCQVNPDVAAATHVNERIAGNTLVSWPYSNNEFSAPPNPEATNNDVATIWGLAYDRPRKNIFISAFLKRHTSLLELDAKPGGDLGRIFVADTSTPSGATTWLNLDGAVSGAITIDTGTIATNIARGVNGVTHPNQSVDSQGFANVGKMGLGDIEISADNSALWVVNIFQNTLHKVAINLDGTPGSIDTFDIPTAQCNTVGGNDTRPFAVKYYEGSVYVGLVCSAEFTGNDADLRAYVYRLLDDGSTGFIEIDLGDSATADGAIDLGYTKGRVGADDFGAAGANCRNNTGWFAWINSWPANCVSFGPIEDTYIYPQPMLSDIEFDIDGSIILGFFDRMGHLGGIANLNPSGGMATRTWSGGDILRVCKTASGFELEGQGSCSKNFTNDNGSEEYYDDTFFAGTAQWRHEEMSLGGLAQLPGSGEIMFSGFDVKEVFEFNLGGTRKLNNTTGAYVSGYEVYDASVNGTFAKAGGIGDVELLCDTPPLEIGNYVWLDKNNDGLQSGDDTLISGVTVTLHDMDNAGNQVGSVITIGGEYYFGGMANVNMTTGTLLPNNNYEVRIDLASAALPSNLLTSTNTGGNATNNRLSDLADNDASEVGGFAVIAFTTDGFGENNHTLDFGFIQSEDWGDAPDSYGTSSVTLGPRHILDADLFLGACVDDELDGQPNATADGDDTGVANVNTNGACAVANDDEDSLTPPVLLDSQIAPNIDVSVINITGNPATVACWVDYNGDGVFDNATERGATTINVSGTATVTLPNVPATASTDTGGSTFMRCRTASLPADVADATGAAANGEVEDYPITISSVYSLGNYVWYDTNQDGIQDAIEVGVNGIDVNLYDNATCTAPSLDSTTTVTNGNDGFYEFTGLIAGTYCVEFTNIPAGYAISPTGAGTAATDSDADVGGLIQNIVLNADDPDEDMGISLDGSIAGLTWCESSTNANTVYDLADGDILMPSIQITLYEDANCNDAVDGGDAGTAVTQDTNGTGDYLFSNLPVGLAPAQVCHITEVDQVDPDLNACDGIITTGTLGPDLDTTNPDSTDNNFGFDDDLSLGNYVWYDANQDGIQDASEIGVNGVDVTLYNNATCTVPSVSTITTITNGNDGFYEFTGLDAGTYCVEFTNIPAGHVISPTGAGTAATDSDADAGGLIQNITLNADDPDEDMGIYVSGTVSGLVWCESDTNPNTTYDAGDADTLQSAIQVTLYDDANCNDTLDGVEAGTAVTQDTVAGLYSFANLITGGPGAGNNPPGCYIVEIDAADPDLGVCDHPITPNPLTPDIDAVNPDNPGNNFGNDEQLSLGDYVWYDNNQDGIQDAGELGINGVTVNLYTTADCSGAISQSTATVNNGNDGFYEFSPLASGDYCVEFITPIGHTISPTGAGTPATDSDADPVTGQVQNIDLQATDPTIDMGVFVPGTISGLVWCESDTNPNTTYDAGDADTLQSAIQVTLYEDTNCNDALDGAEAATAITQDTVVGLYSFTDLITGGPGAINPPGCYIVEVDSTDTDLGVCDHPITLNPLTPDIDAVNPDNSDNNFGNDEQLSLGDYVWYDNNQDGIQDAGELGINGVTVNLYTTADCSGAISQATATVNNGNDGFYEFSPLAVGDYCVEFIAPAGHTISPTGAGTPTTDSDADPVSGQVQNIDLQATDPTIDMGVFVPGTISGLVWCESDTNPNNTYDAGDADTLQSAIQVTLYEDANCNDTLDGSEAGTAVTQDTVAGLYSFADLITGGPGAFNPPGCYIVEVDNSDTDLGVCDHPITPNPLTPDVNASNPSSPDNNFGNDEVLTLGDIVWYDNNQDGIQDPNEPGVNGITVDLYPTPGCTGAPVQTTTTAIGGTPAADGWYEFSPLATGDYCLEFTGLPIGWVFTDDNQGGDDTQDSDADPTTGQITNIDLQSNDADEDAGIYAAIGTVPGNMFCDDSPANGTFDTGEEQPNITINLYRDTDCDGTGDVLFSSQDTDSNGEYLFENVPVAFAPVPPNPEVCYVVNYDTNDSDFGDCTTPILPEGNAIELTTDAPNAPDTVFGTTLGTPPTPIMIPVNSLWALMLLVLFMLIIVRNKQYKIMLN